MNHTTQSIPSEDQLIKRLVSKGFDLDSVQPFLDYAQAVIEREIRLIRAALKAVNQAELRHEYLARIDSLQIVKSLFNAAELAQQIGKLDQEETHLNVI